MNIESSKMLEDYLERKQQSLKKVFKQYEAFSKAIHNLPTDAEKEYQRLFNKILENFQNDTRSSCSSDFEANSDQSKCKFSNEKTEKVALSSIDSESSKELRSAKEFQESKESKLLSAKESKVSKEFKVSKVSKVSDESSKASNSIINYHSILKFTIRNQIIENLRNYSSKLKSQYVPDHELDELLKENNILFGQILNLPIQEQSDNPVSNTLYYKSKFVRSLPEEPCVELDWQLKSRIIISLSKNRQTFCNFPFVSNKAKLELIDENNDLTNEIFQKLNLEGEKIRSISESLADDLAETLEQNTLIVRLDANNDKQVEEKNEKLNDLPNNQLNDELNDQLKDQLNDQLDGQLYGELDGKLNGQINSELKDQLNDQLDGQLNGELNDELDGQLNGQLNGILDDQEKYDKGKRKYDESKENKKKARKPFYEKIGKTVKVFENKNDSYLKSTKPLATKPLRTTGYQNLKYRFQIDDFDDLFESNKSIPFPFSYNDQRFTFYVQSKIIEGISVHRSLDLYLKCHSVLNEPLNLKLSIKIFNSDPTKNKVFKRFMSFFRCEKFLGQIISYDDLVNNNYNANNILDMEIELGTI